MRSLSYEGRARVGRTVAMLVRGARNIWSKRTDFGDEFAFLELAVDQRDFSVVVELGTS